ncbi:MAG: hypothetical protein R3E79_00510 [Caldilineaceae bacterium]
MKGLEIAKDFYTEWGKDYLEKSFPDLAKRVAIGRIFGSDVICADDEISKDHNWGPQFTIFLSAADYAAHGEKVAQVLNAAAPNPWKGFRLDGGGDHPILEVGRSRISQGRRSPKVCAPLGGINLCKHC